MKAIFEYPETQEDEEVDLNQLLEDGEVALSKLTYTLPTHQMACDTQTAYPDYCMHWADSCQCCLCLRMHVLQPHNKHLGTKHDLLLLYLGHTSKGCCNIVRAGCKSVTRCDCMFVECASPMLCCAEEARPVGHKLCRDEFLVPDDSEEFDESPAQSIPESMEQEPLPPPLEELEEQQYAPEEEEDDIPDAGAIEEEPSEESDASMAAPSDNASSSSDDNALVSIAYSSCGEASL